VVHGEGVRQLCAEGDESILNGALAAAAQGWRVTPLYGLVEVGGSRQCDCKAGPDCRSAGKHPRFNGFTKSATTDPQVIQQWWQKHPNSNLGILTGPPFGLVLDLDPRNGSDEEWPAFQRDHGELPDTLSAASGGSGTHRVYDYPAGTRITTSLLILDSYSGIDVKGQTQFIVAEPSLHMSGNRYRWNKPLDFPRAELPHFMLQGVSYDSALVLPEDCNKWTRTVFTEECQRVRSAQPGQRHNVLYRAACNVGRVVAGGQIDRDVAIGVLEDAADSTGLPEYEARDVILDAFEATKDQPRRPTPYRGRADALAHVAAMKEALKDYPWSGRNGSTDMLCMEAMFTLAEQRGGPQFTASQVGVARLMRVASRTTAGKALKRCQQAGLLRLVQKGFKGKGSVWKITVPVAADRSCSPSYRDEADPPTYRDEGDTPTTPVAEVATLSMPDVGPYSSPIGDPCPTYPSTDAEVLHTPTYEDAVLIPLSSYGQECNTPSLVGHDLFMGPVHHRMVRTVDERTGEITDGRAKGLGPTGLRIYRHLLASDEPKSMRQVAGELRISPSTVSRRVAQMGGDLIEVTDSGIRAIPVGEDRLEDLAAQRGLLGAGEGLDARFERMRPTVPMWLHRLGVRIVPRFLKGRLNSWTVDDDVEENNPEWINFDWREAA